MSDGFVTVAQCVEGLPLGRCVWEALLCGFLAWLLLGAINDCTPLAFSLLDTEWDTTQESVLAMSAALALGSFVAIAIAGMVADVHGRLAVVQPALMLTVAAGVVLQTARTFMQALIARFLLGLMSGGLLTVMPALIAELLPSRHRGYHLTIWTCGWPVGCLMSLALGCMLPGVGWRSFYTLPLVPAMFLYMCTRLDMLPESPRFLYMAGRRDEGYETLLDMYEKEELPLPWAPEIISVTCAPAAAPPAWPAWSDPTSDKGKGIPAHVFVTLWLSLAMFFASAAAQSVKLWMPTMLIAHHADTHAGGEPTMADAVDLSSLLNFASGPQALSLLNVVRAPLMMSAPDYGAIRVLAEAYVVQLVGIILCAHLSISVPRKHLVRWPLLVAAGLTVLNLVAATGRYHKLLCGPLVGAQLAASSTSINFLTVFALEYFATARRAQVVALATFAAQLGSLAVPVLGGFVVRHVSAAAAVASFAALYVLAFAVTWRLPLPSGPERPLHDVDEDKPRFRRKAGAGARKQMTDYQAC